MWTAFIEGVYRNDGYLQVSVIYAGPTQKIRREYRAGTVPDDLWLTRLIVNELQQLAGFDALEKTLSQALGPFDVDAAQKALSG